jgi:hypothetical protein
MPLHFLVILKLTLQLSCDNSSNFLQCIFLRTRCWIFEHGVGVEARFCGFGVFKSKTIFLDQLCTYETNHRVPNLSHLHLEILTVSGH